MKTLLKIVVGVVGVVVLVAVGGYAWASISTSRMMSRTFDTHDVDFPVPFPLTAEEQQEVEAERSEPASEEQIAELALARAVERGGHLLRSRYACMECHGQDFGGGVMVDDPALGRLLGPNVTTGQGSRTLEYRPDDWDRIVRHGIRPDGTPSAMPAEDFQLMSDRELSDIVAYIRSLPPVDAEVPRVSLGPLGKVLMATGQLPVAADIIPDHFATHRQVPPPAEATVEFGRHLAAVCTGCHGQNLAGGPIRGGDPSWPPSRNLTPHPEGLEGWSYEQFVAALTSGSRPDGTALREPMTLVLPYAANMEPVELEALWTYLRSVPPMPTGS